MGVVIWLILGYLIGSVSSGLALARLRGLGDLRAVGSGNIGATNVLRTGDRSAAALTLLGDALKGVIVVLLARWTAGEQAAQMAGFGAFVGHCFPVWSGFRGGKGVATYLGVTLAAAFPIGLAACAVWAWVAWRMRISSLAALVAAGVAPLFALTSGYERAVLLLLVMGALLFWRHSANIKRLRARTEPRIGAS